MDPQQRLLLETTWEALEHAGIPADSLLGSATGVFVGLISHEYENLSKSDNKHLDGHLATGTSSAVASGRISYLLGLQGPSLTLDTACSSSLVAIHMACQSLRSGECDLATAGGVTLMLTPAVFVMFSRLRDLAADGRCKTFDAAADGMGFSDGCGMVVLKRLSDARADGDPVLAVVRGSAVNQDGRSSCLTAPNGLAQQAVIRQALVQAGVEPGQVDYAECHGTGTQLGDSIEVQALAQALAQGHDAKSPLLLGSVKSNLGHTQAAAGVAGVIKTVLALGQKKLPPNLHFSQPSPEIPWTDLPVKVVSETTRWERDGSQTPRLAGVSSFGFSGTNAHLVLAEPPPVDDESPAPAGATEPAGYLLPLSAQTPEALQELAGRYAEQLATKQRRLLDTCHTAGVGRTHFQHRLAVIGSNRGDLQTTLAEVAAGERPDGAFFGRASSRQGSQCPGMDSDPDAAQPVLATLESLAGLYANGGEVDWQRVTQGGRRVALPTYAFQRQRFWIEADRSLPTLPQRADGHPLLGLSLTLSTAPETRIWETTLAVDQLPWPTEQRLQGEPGAQVLTRAALVEMALAAGRETFAGARPVLEEMTMPMALAPPEQSLTVQTVVNEVSPGRLTFHISSRTSNGGQQSWTENACGALVRGPATAAADILPEGSAEVEDEEDDWILRVGWEPVPCPEASVPAGGRWLLLADRSGLAEELEVCLEERGHAVVYAPLTADLPPPEGKQLQALLSEAFGEGLPATGIVFLWGIDDLSEPEGSLAVGLERGCLSALRLVQALARTGWRDLPRLWLVTRGVQAVDFLAQVAPAQAPLLGLGRTIAMEHPELRCSRVDLDWQPRSGEAGELAAELVADDNSEELCLRHDGRRVARLQRRLAIDPPDQESVAGRPFRLQIEALGGTYLITGGLGRLGLEVARWLCDLGARNLLLLARRSATGEQQEAVAQLRAGGVEVRLVSADVADIEALAEVLEQARSMPPLRGVVHAAGVLANASLLEQDTERFVAVMPAKVTGAWNLHRVTRDLPLDFFVMFSSAAALLGSPGQGNCAAANAYLGAFAHYRRAQGLPALTIDWGAFTEAAMAVTENRGAHLSFRGLAAITPGQGLKVLERVLDTAAAQVGVAAIDIRQWVEFYPTMAGSSLLGRLLQDRFGPTQEQAGEPGLLTELNGAAGPQRRAIVEHFLTAQAALVLGAETEPERDRSLSEQGMTSLKSLELRNRIEAGTGLRLMAATLWTYPCLADLTDHILELLRMPAVRETEPETAQAARRSREQELDTIADDELARLLAAKLTSSKVPGTPA